MNASDNNYKRILYIMKEYPYPPATSGDAVYSRGIINSLSSHFKITVICASSGSKHNPPSTVDWNITRPQRIGRVNSIISRWPLVAWKGATRDFHTELDRLMTHQWDGIILDNLGVVHALPKAIAYRRNNRQTIIGYISHEQEFASRRSKYGSYQIGFFERIATYIDLFKIKQSENKILNLANFVTVINDNDIEPFKSISQNQNYISLMPGYDGPIIEKRIIDSRTSRRVLLLGGRKSKQKQQILIDWLKEGQPILNEQNIETWIVGDIGDDLKSKLSREHPEINFTGFVDDTSDIISTARAGIIADTVGGGFKLRLLSHVFQRLPLIGLDEAIDGLPTPEGQGYISARNLKELAILLVQTIDDYEKLNILQQTAFLDCEEKFSWSKRIEPLAEALNVQARR